MDTKFFTIVIAGIGFFTLVAGTPPCAYAQSETMGIFPGGSKVLQMPVSDAILKFLNTNEWLNTVNKYIKVPLTGTDVKNVGQGQALQVNRDIATETGVDIFKLFRFIGEAVVIILESTARILKGLIPLIP